MRRAHQLASSACACPVGGAPLALRRSYVQKTYECPAWPHSILSSSSAPARPHPCACARLHGRSAEDAFLATEDLQQPHEALADVEQPAACARAPRFNASALGGYACPLFARKFLAESAAAALESAPHVWLRAAA